MNRTTNIMKVP